MKRRLGLAGTLCALLVGMGSAQAGLLQPQTIDAGTGADAVDVGAAFGNRQAWAGLEQASGGVTRLYVAHAQDGVFAGAQTADRGNRITSAALTGNANGDAVVVFTEPVGGVSTLFGRRLSGGQIGPMLQISTNAQNVQSLRVHRLRQVAENASGVAAVCYIDNATGQVWAAVLGASASSWTRFGPLTNTECDDIAVDVAGDTIVLGIDGGNRAGTDRIVGGVLQPGEEVDPNAKDEPALAVWGNSVLVLARVELNTGPFDANAWKLNDIAAGGAYQSLGPIDGGLLDPNGNYNVEFAKAAVAANGKGIVTFRLGNPGTQTSLDYVRTFDASPGSPFGQPQKLAGESKLEDVTPVADANGDGLALWGDENGATVEQHVRSFASGAPAQDVILQDASVNSETGFEADASGDFLAVAERGSSPVRVAAFFADFLAPTLAATAPPKPRVARLVALHAGAADTFEALPASSVQWQFSPGSIAGSTSPTGQDVSVRFATVGTVIVHVTATDEGGNATTAQLSLKATAAAKLRAPRTARKGARARFMGTGFAPGKPVTLSLGHGKKLKRFGRARPGTTGRFSVRLRVKASPGRYVVRACQLGCRIKATARLRLR